MCSNNSPLHFMFKDICARNKDDAVTKNRMYAMLRTIIQSKLLLSKASIQTLLDNKKLCRQLLRKSYPVNDVNEFMHFVNTTYAYDAYEDTIHLLFSIYILCIVLLTLTALYVRDLDLHDIYIQAKTYICH